MLQLCEGESSIDRSLVSVMMVIHDMISTDLDFVLEQ
jgi:hypothetical protein